MALVYCEICGILIKGGQAPIELPEGVICEGCFASRKAVVTEAAPPAAPAPDGVVQFDCCYCESLLRLKAVARRTRVRCPKCGEAFYLHPDGHIEAKLEGGRTAVLQKDDVAPPPLTSAEQDSGMKTQPLKRPPSVNPSASQQRAMLEELKPKRLDFIDSIPDRGAGPAPVIDTDQYETPAAGPPGGGGGLDLAPEGVGPGQTDAFELRPTGEPDSDPELDLRPSEEGEVDFDAAGLKRKTSKLRPSRSKGKGSRRRRGGRRVSSRRSRPPEEPEPQPEEELGPEEREARAEQAKAEREERKRRERRLAQAGTRGQQLAAERERRTLGAALLWGLLVLPVLTGVGLAAMTTRGTGFATRGGFGRGLAGIGESVDVGIRTLNDFLPEGARLALPEDD